MAKYREILDIPKRLFAIGDIHACLNEVIVLLSHIEEKEGLSEEDMVIFIGDYIDRGSESKSVIEYLLQFKAKFPETVFLRGNHEEMLLGFLGFEGGQGESYIPNGGADFLSSYGLLRAGSRDEILAGIPSLHLGFFLGLECYVMLGDYVFVHAGLNPLRGLRSQINDDIFWIRDQFILNVHHFDKTVIFGHTPYQNIMFNLPYKIGIDTGLVYGNMLSCIELTERKVFQVKRGEGEVKISKFPEPSTTK